MPPELSVPFSSTYTQYTDFIFCPNLVPMPKSLNTKVENISLTPSPSGAPNKVFELLLNTYILTDVQMQMNAFLHPLLILNAHNLKNWAMMTRNDFKMEDKVYGTFMYEGPSPLPDGISHSILTNTSGEGPTHL